MAVPLSKPPRRRPSTMKAGSDPAWPQRTPVQFHRAATSLHCRARSHRSPATVSAWRRCRSRPRQVRTHGHRSLSHTADVPDRRLGNSAPTLLGGASRRLLQSLSGSGSGVPEPRRRSRRHPWLGPDGLRRAPVSTGRPHLRRPVQADATGRRQSGTAKPPQEQTTGANPLPAMPFRTDGQTERGPLPGTQPLIFRISSASIHSARFRLTPRSMLAMGRVCIRRP